MKQNNYEALWNQIEEHGLPCRIIMLCDLKKTYTGPGVEYIPLWGLRNHGEPFQLEEIRRGRGMVLWGKLANGQGWIELNEVTLCDEE